MFKVFMEKGGFEKNSLPAIEFKLTSKNDPEDEFIKKNPDLGLSTSYVNNHEIIKESHYDFIYINISLE